MSDKVVRQLLGKTKISMEMKKCVVNWLLCVLIASATISVAATNTTAHGAVRGGNINITRSPTENNTSDFAGGSQEGSRVEEHCTDLARDEETLLVFSTLGGGLTGIDPVTSEIRWTIEDDPPVMAEQQENVQVPQYLPDPRDGSIYQMGDMGDLKKLPYTIPQLVANAPCRSSDGILYSGKKSDTWFLIDPKSGRREKVMGFGGPVDGDNSGRHHSSSEKIGWATSRSIYLGRTQYTVMMYDSMAQNKNTKPWNITFYDYNSHTMAPDITKEYEYIHLTTTSNGNIVTLDRKTGKFFWKKDLTSPVVAAFLLGSEGLLSVPFTTVSDEAFDAILEESQDGNVNTVRLFQTLYVGEHQHGLYAFPSLVDKNTPRISTDLPVKLLDGPDSDSSSEQNIVYVNQLLEKNHNAIIFGYYDLPPKATPDKNSLQITPSPTKDVSNHDLATINRMHDMASKAKTVTSADQFTETADKQSADVGVQTDTTTPPFEELEVETNAFNRTKKIILANSDKLGKFLNEWFMEHPSGRVHQILILIILAMVAMFWYMWSTMRELKNQSENGSKTYGVTGSERSSGGSDGSGGSFSPEEVIDLGGGHVRVGKIAFNSNEILGKGCEGTFVFKGTFEERFVAVKRLLPECFTFADREVALLRESDAHENVVRYFCTEQDRQFRYIAVELCAATLQDYSEGEQSEQLRTQIGVWEVLRQSAAGLSHLHSLHIVHRDIKPQNVLLSLPGVNGVVRVMISDFGLCKKLNYGKTSFSRRSGVTGTEGWIAPEMMYGQRTTTSVDIFSLGCVYYYVLSGGQHAFGDALKRQANILANEYNLKILTEEYSGGERSKMILAEQLIADMIHKNSQCRPAARYIGNHPVFWNNQKILAFLQDVSDRVEKLQFQTEPLKSLEKNGRMVVREDWNLHVDPLITDDLRKYRAYMGASVRDLLRALRNKKHHYHELEPEVRDILGCIPKGFTNYWLDRFPHLISHVYHAFSICGHEPIFQPYYNSDYKFTRPQYFDEDDAFYPMLMRDPKHLTKSSAAGGGSPRKLSTPEKQQKTSQRRGAYNFRRSYKDGGWLELAEAGGGLQRNLDGTNNVADDLAAATVASVDGPDKRGAYANFKFRRFAKTNRNFGGNKEKNVTWMLSQPDNE